MKLWLRFKPEVPHVEQVQPFGRGVAKPGVFLVPVAAVNEDLLAVEDQAVILVVPLEFANTQRTDEAVHAPSPASRTSETTV